MCFRSWLAQREQFFPKEGGTMLLRLNAAFAAAVARGGEDWGVDEGQKSR